MEIITRPEMRRVKNFRLLDSSLATCAPLIAKLVSSFFNEKGMSTLTSLVDNFDLGVSVVSSAVGAWGRLCLREDDMILVLSTRRGDTMLNVDLFSVVHVSSHLTSGRGPC